VTTAPDVPEYVKGTVAFQNKLVPVVDLRMLLGMTSAESDGRPCIIVDGSEKDQRCPTGLAVDAVRGVEDIPEKDLRDVADAKIVLGISSSGASYRILLDIERLLSEMELGNMQLRDNR
jgi:purine-binding chemotaxis protein CheW